jgi:hypothetical protein
MEYWIIKKEIEDQDAYNKAIEKICWFYAIAKELNEMGINLVSTDEKTGIQALERDILPMIPGHVEKQDSEYKRNGTCCLIANIEVSTGKIISPSITDSRTEEDFLNHISETVKLDNKGKWIFVTDNLNTHLSESLVKFVATEENISEDSLGKKGKTGILKSMESRKEFLEDTSHRVSFAYTPKHTSWMNQIEIWFGFLVKKLLKRARFCTIDELKNKIRVFIQYFNDVMAKPFKWTYKGIPLTSGING